MTFVGTIFISLAQITSIGIRFHKTFTMNKNKEAALVGFDIVTRNGILIDVQQSER